MRRTLTASLLLLMLSAAISRLNAAGGDPDANSAAGKAFLAENRGKPGVTTTASGLQYLVLVAGSGPAPTRADRVTVHYRGTLIDGTEFDGAYGEESASFGLEEVIPGWAEALQLMPVGSTYRLFIPPELGYGEQGAGLMIGPNATLLFEIELLAIEP